MHTDVQITVSYMRKNRAGKFTCYGTPVEIMIERTSDYSGVLKKSRENVEIPNQPRHRLVLLTFGGAVIPKKEGWTVREYMKTLHRGPSNTKFGVGFIKVRVRILELRNVFMFMSY